MIAILAGIAIKQQRQGLQRQVAELSRLLSENWELQCKIRNAHQRTTEINELFLRRVSAELHDGPAQLLGFALLRLDAVRPWRADHQLVEVADEFQTVRNALSEALNEIRHISAGLAPPELAGLTLAEVLEMAATRHARRTGTTVECDLRGLPDCLDPSLRVCLYRFAQEGLNNAFRHAGGRGQVLQARCNDELLEVAVADSGSVHLDPRPMSESEGLGLSGLRGRIESLGGVFGFWMRPGQGACLTARFALSKVEVIHA
jgi:signal transduction histidine kinase